MTRPQSTFSALMRAWRDEGNAEAGDQVVRMVYDHLHWLAEYYLSREHQARSLQPTDLVNETCLRLFGTTNIEWQDQNHFFVVAARQMRRILIDRARSARSGRKMLVDDPLSLAQASGLSGAADVDLLALDEALERLEEFAPRAGRVVELRYFAGLTEQQAAQALGVSVTTVKRDWNLARLWLFEQLGKGDGAPATAGMNRMGKRPAAEAEAKTAGPSPGRKDPAV